MAGDWIPVRVDLHSTPEVLRLSRLTGKSVDEVVGLLVRFWAWVQAHTDDGCLSDLELNDLALGAGVPERFLGALVRVGWLSRAPESGLQVPNFHRWLSGGAKRRLRDRERKRNASPASKKGSDKEPEPLPQTFRKNSASKRKTFRSEAEKKRTTEEERREENKSPPEWISTHTLLALEPSLGRGRAQRVCAALNRWFAYLAQRGRPPVDPQERAAALLRMFPQVETLEGVIDYAVANEYVSLRTSMADRLPQGSSREENPVVKALQALTQREGGSP